MIIIASYNDAMVIGIPEICSEYHKLVILMKEVP
jgi:hypothetical protein